MNRLISLAGLFSAGTALYFFARWIYWLRFTHIYVYSFPRMAISVNSTFFLFGLALIALDYKKLLTARVIGIVCAIIGAVELSYGTLHMGFNIDLFLSSIFYSDHQMHFLKMAPNSSVAVICTGISVFLLSQKERKEFTTLLANIFGGMALTLGLVSLFGYSTGLVTAYTWRNFVGMSVYTAEGFSILGFAICFHALQIISLRKRQVHAPILVALSLLAITIQFYRAQSDAEIRSIQASTRDRATAIEDQFLGRLDEHIASLRRMGKRWDLQNGTNEKVWLGDAIEHLENLNGFTHLCWINESGVTEWCEPKDEKINMSSSAIEHLKASKNGLYIESSHRVHPGVSAMVSVSRFRKPDGAILGNIRFDRILNDHFDFSGYAVQLQSQNDILLKATENLDSEWTIRSPIEYAGMEFILNVTPLPTQVAKFLTPIPTVVLGMGILLSWLVSYGTFLFFITRENALLNQDRLAWEQAISTGSDLIFVTFDREGLVKSFNPAAEKFFEYDAREVVDRVTPIIWHVQDEVTEYATRLSKELGKTISSTTQALIAKTQSGNIDRNEWTFITKNKTRKRGELSVHPLKGRLDETIGYVGIVRDLTIQRETESKLVQSSKMASLGEMASGVAHEINNPLTIIQGRAYRILQQSERAETIPVEILQEQLRSIVEMSRRISKIIRGLAIFSRNAENDPMEPAELNQVIEDTLELCRERFKESGISLDVQSIPDAVLSCRPTEVSQVLLNLLNNAFDAIESLPEKWVRIDVSLTANERIQIAITDSGHGLPDEVATKMMEPFFSTKGVGKGTGLGLSISKGIVESHGGKLFVDRSFPNTRFIVELPLASSDGESPIS